MTLLWGHELATALATAAALLAVLTGGQVEPVAWAALGVIPGALLLRQRGHGLPTLLGGVLALASVAFGVVFTMRTGIANILLGAGYALFLLVVVRLLNRETPAHDLQLYTLSLLLLLDAAALNISWLYAPCFLVYTISIVWALTTRELKRAAQEDHLQREGAGDAPLWHEPRLLRGRFFAATAGIAIVVLVGTLSLFVVFPRVGLGMLRIASAQRSSGFANSVTLGGSGLISQDNTVVMRITALDGLSDTLPLNLYFRGSAFDRYDGVTWSRSSMPPDRGNTLHARMPRSKANVRRYSVALEPLGIPYLFTSGQVRKLSVTPGPRVFQAAPVPQRDGFGDMLLPFSPHDLVTYEVEAALSMDDDFAEDAPEFPMPAEYSSLEAVPVRVQNLALEWTAGREDPIAKVAAIATRLRTFTYDLEDEPPPFGTSALEHFLFTRKAGHCEYFATALALMARSVGIPARIVGGYQGGAMHQSETYTVLRQSDAHAWTEFYVQGRGWLAMDATPGSVLARPPMGFLANITETLQSVWEEYVIDFDLGLQVDAARSMQGMLQRLRDWRPGNSSAVSQMLPTAAAGLSVLMGLALAWRFRRRFLRQAPPGIRLGRALEAAAVRVAGQAPPHATAGEWVQSLEPLVDAPTRQLLQEARGLYEGCRFGDLPLDAQAELEWVGRLGSVRALKPDARTN